MSSPNLKIFCKNFVAIHWIKWVLTFDKPIYVGFSILDLRKLFMHDFHYNYITAKYNCGAKLIFTDTDSLVYETERDAYEDFYEDSSFFDFTNYDKDLRFYDLVNKMKDKVK